MKLCVSKFVLPLALLSAISCGDIAKDSEKYDLNAVVSESSGWRGGVSRQYVFSVAEDDTRNSLCVYGAEARLSKEESSTPHRDILSNHLYTVGGETARFINLAKIQHTIENVAKQGEEAARLYDTKAQACSVILDSFSFATDSRWEKIDIHVTMLSQYTPLEVAIGQYSGYDYITNCTVTDAEGNVLGTDQECMRRKAFNGCNQYFTRKANGLRNSGESYLSAYQTLVEEAERAFGPSQTISTDTFNQDTSGYGSRVSSAAAKILKSDLFVDALGARCPASGTVASRIQ